MPESGTLQAPEISVSDAATGHIIGTKENPHIVPESGELLAMTGNLEERPKSGALRALEPFSIAVWINLDRRCEKPVNVVPPVSRSQSR